MQAPGAPYFGWYGDDFTGATDTLATLARAGWRAMLWLDVPSADALAQVGPLDACGIAGAARAMAPDAMRAELDPVGRYFQRLGVRVLHYKVCSTFDSAPGVGNIATAIDTLAPYASHPVVPIVGGQPSLGRYAVFSTLYARAGTDGQVHRLDRHPIMSRHPVTPMREADLRRHLEALGLPPVGAWHYPDYAQAPEQQDAALDALIEQLRDASPQRQSVLFDAATHDDLACVGRQIVRLAARSPVLAVGASSVAQAVVAASTAQGTDASVDSPISPANGPVLVLAGSLSPMTARQIDHARSYHVSTLDPRRLRDDPGYADQRRRETCASLASGRHTLVHTTPPDAAYPMAPLDVAAVCAQWLANTVKAMDAMQPLTRLGIAGGDTSSLAVRALGVDGLAYLGTLCAGVTVCRVRAAGSPRDGMALMLKGGQMGGDDLFERLVSGVG